MESFPFSPGQAARRFPAAVRALEQLGYSRTEARERMARAWEEAVREDSAREDAGENSPIQDNDLEQTLLNRALRPGRSTPITGSRV